MRALVIAVTVLAAAAGCRDSAPPRHVGQPGDTAPSTTVPVDAGTPLGDSPGQAPGDAAGHEPAADGQPHRNPGGGTGHTRPSTTTTPTTQTTSAGYNGKPVPAGTYRFDTQGSNTYGSDTVPMPAVTTLVVDPADAAGRQRSTRDLRDVRGNGVVSAVAGRFAPEGVYLESLTASTTANGFTDTREYRPDSPQLVVPAGAKVGDSYAYDLHTEGVDVHVVGKVVRAERVTVGGQAVDTLVVATTSTFSGAITGTVNADGWVAPSARMIVRERGDADLRVGIVRAVSQWTAMLTSLTPS